MRSLEKMIAGKLHEISDLVAPLCAKNTMMFSTNKQLYASFSTATVGSTFVVRSEMDMMTGSDVVGVSWFVDDGTKTVEKMQKFSSPALSTHDEMFADHVCKQVLMSCLEDMADSPNLMDHTQEFMELCLMAFPEWRGMQAFLAASVDRNIVSLDDALGDENLVDLLMLDHGVLSQSKAEKRLASLILQGVISMHQFLFPSRLEKVEPFYCREETSPL